MMQPPPSYDNVGYTPHPGEPSPPYNQHVLQPTAPPPPPVSSVPDYPPPPYTYSPEQYQVQQSAAPSYYPPSSPSPSVMYSASQQQQQQQSIAVNTFNRAPVIVQPAAPYQSYAGHIVLSIIVCLVCGNLLFGVIAFVLANAADGSKRRDRQAARRLGNASISMSVIGIIGSIVVVIILASVFGSVGRSSSSTVCNGGPYYSGGGYFTCRRSVASNSNCHESFDKCCNLNELDYSLGYCYSGRVVASSTTMTTSSAECSEGPFYASSDDYQYTCRRYVWSNSKCRSSFDSCCNSNELTYSFGYCYSGRVVASSTTMTTSSAVCSGGPYYASSDGYQYTCRRYVWSNSNCLLSSFDSCCNSNELTYSLGYCYSGRVVTSSTTMTTPSVDCSGGPFYASSDGYYYTCRRYALFNSNCYRTFDSCCKWTEDAYYSAYCYRGRLVTSSTTASPTICTDGPYDAGGVLYRCRRLVLFDAACRHTYSTCCYSTESVYRSGYCFSRRLSSTTTMTSY